jgi:hypothetical protein
VVFKIAFVPLSLWQIGVFGVYNLGQLVEPSCSSA